MPDIYTVIAMLAVVVVMGTAGFFILKSGSSDSTASVHFAAQSSRTVRHQADVAITGRF